MNKFSRCCARGALGGALFTASLAYAQTQLLAPHNVPGPRPATPPAVSPAATPPAAVPSAAGDNNLGTATLAARVNPDGTLNTGAGATGASKIAGLTGTYEVIFNRDVSKCFYSASSFLSGYVATALEPRAGNANGVYLEMQSLTGTAVDTPFYLTVFCAK
ncbi:MAG TPA: hypothetical protein PKA55_14080 [Rhodoblastus sp.]|nr:hypothetical protein [Rhodoblastus sp.]